MEEKREIQKMMSLKNNETITLLFVIERFGLLLFICGLAKMEEKWYLLYLGIVIYSFTSVFHTMCHLEDLFSESCNEFFENKTRNTNDENNKEILRIEAPKEVANIMEDESKTLEKDNDREQQDWELITLDSRD